jgi:ApaG protein
MNSKSIVVRPIPQYLPEQSSAEEGQFVFAYTITIENHSDEPAQLLSRHWVITDANETVQEVRGEGVVGEQPILKPGEAFRYTSGCTLSTPFGTMKGSYQMRTSSGKRFEADIPEFLLAVPSRLH